MKIFCAECYITITLKDPTVESLRIKQTFGYGVMIEWLLPASCYGIVSIKVNVDGGKVQRLTTPADALSVQVLLHIFIGA